MDSAQQIKSFLDKVRKRRSLFQFSSNFFLILALVIGGALIINIVAFYSSPALPIIVVFSILWIISLIFLCIYITRKNGWSSLSTDQTALFIEKKVQGLQNSLINSIQLEPHLHKSQHSSAISFEFIEELITRTGKQVKDLDYKTLVNPKNFFQSGLILLSVVSIALVLNFFIPEFWTQGYEKLASLPGPTKETKLLTQSKKSNETLHEEPNYSLSKFTLAYNYPAYTRLKQKTIDPSDGKINVFPGTEVIIQAQSNHPLAGSSLVINGTDRLSMDVTKDINIRGRIIIREPGHYQYEIKSPKNNKILLPEEYPITLIKDKSPHITIFLANPKPVYFLTDKVQFFYEASDDFGIQKVELVINVNGKIQKKLIKNIKGFQTELKGDYTWELSTLDILPGDEVQYYLEIFDNDTILGPNAGQSEVFSFEIFDEKKKHLDLIALQEELVERMVELLARSLVSNMNQYENTPEGLDKLKHTLAYNTDQLIRIINLAQSIQTQAEEIQSFPQPYLTLIKNIISGLNGIREEQIQTMNQISNAIVKATPIGLNFPPVDSVNDKLIAHLERDILFLIKMLNRERMSQVIDMEKDLSELAESLREELEKARDKKSELNTPEMKSMIKKLKETLQKIMEQLARQNQSLPDEFLNQNAFESLNMESFDSSLEKLMDLINQGKMDQAMEELEKMMDDLRAFSDQLQDMQDNQQNLVDMEILNQLNESLSKIEELEAKEKHLLDKTTDINKKLRSQQFKKFENRLQDFFQSLKKDVNDIQKLLGEDEHVLEDHPKMKTYSKLMDQEANLRQNISELNQKTVDSAGKKDVRQKFQDLNKARKNLSDVMNKMHDLHMKMFQGFQSFLPQLTEKYNKLEELTELMDLYEFNSLFQRTYPEILRWQNHFRTARDLDSSLQDKMKADLNSINEINREISKKLGTLMRDISKDYQSMISEEDTQKLQNLSKQQQQMRHDAMDLEEIFRGMNQKNPMITPELSRGMKNAGRQMMHAERGLENKRIPESIESENRALKKLSEIKEMLNQLKNADSGQGPNGQQRMFSFGQGQARENQRGRGSTRMQQEKVNLPSEDQYKVPGQFREEILKAMKNRYPQKYQRMVNEYYKELVK